MYDISIIIPTISPRNLTRIIANVRQQSANGIKFELIIIQESNKQEEFHKVDFGGLLCISKIIRQTPNQDYGAKAKDEGLKHVDGEYCLFWDDDNIYYPHAIAAQYSNACGFDIGVCRTYHECGIVPDDFKIAPGNIDTMCMCVNSNLAVKGEWSNGSKMRYSDYRYLSSLLKEEPTIRFSKTIIGHHL
jgi:glycosyltransferase involved in cell wall biosynthesis